MVGTASVRRRAQLLALRPDLEVRELRGNVDTRLRRLAEGDFDAIVLAQAGPRAPRPRRRGRAAAGARARARPGLPGARGAQPTTSATAAAAAVLTDRAALTALTAERALVTALGATCNTPSARTPPWSGDDGSALDRVRRACRTAPTGSATSSSGAPGDPAALGRAVAERLEAAGARELLDEAERAALDVR